MPRDALVDRLVGHHPAIISVVAPPGYGKTTVLAQWAARMSPRAAWVSVDESDNDPVVLLTYITTALDRVEPIDRSILRMLASPAATITVVHRLTAAIESMTETVAVVLDNLEAVKDPTCLDAITQFALSLPDGSRLALASRNELPIPAARLRAQGAIVEIGADDLAMSTVDAPGLLEAAGVDPDHLDVDDVVERTEGWPVGLYLAALAMKAGTPHREAGFTFTGDDRFMGDYLRSEFLSRAAEKDVRFLTRTSVLDRMSGPLCDATLDEHGSDIALRELEARNLLLVPLDRTRHWYRYHHLFRELLYAELRQREPDAVDELHRRAATWCEANGMAETAMDHAQAAGDADRVAALILDLAQPVWASGRITTVLSWMEWLDRHGLVEHYPAVAVHGALIFALLGRPADAERWARFAERARHNEVLPDGSSMAGLLAYLRALLCRDGIEEMRRDAKLAWNGLSADSPYRATMRHTEGVSYLVEGDLDRADSILAHALDGAVAAGALPLAAMVLAERGIVALERTDDWPEATALAEEAVSIVRDGEFGEYWSSALVYALAARVACHAGEVTRARAHAARAARLRPLLTYALPVISVQALLELARAYAALADPGGARAVLRQVKDILQQRPGLGVLPAHAEQLRSQLDTMAGTASGASSLTAAELRLLPLLGTHLSFREIADRLYLSRHTVKSHAISIYRKLGVSGRSEAIARMQELGLYGS